MSSTSILFITTQGIVVLGVFLQKGNPSPAWDYEQSEQVSMRREGRDGVMLNQVSHYTLSKLLTACTVIFVKGWDRRSHSNVKEAFTSTFGTQSWEKPQLQHSATVVMVTLTLRLHRKLCKPSVPYVRQRLAVHANSCLGSDLHEKIKSTQYTVLWDC